MRKLKHMKILGKIISAEDKNEECRDLNENERAYLLDEGFIEESRWTDKIPGGVASFSTFVATDLGRQTYFEWMEWTS